MDGELEFIGTVAPERSGGGWLGRVPRAPRWAVRAAVVAALAAGSYAYWTTQRGPDLNSLSIDVALLTEHPARWSDADADAGPDSVGRVLLSTARVVLEADSLDDPGERWVVRVTGWSGPGLGTERATYDPYDREAPDPSVVLGEDGPRGTVAVTLAIDCAAAPLPLPLDAYAMRVRVTSAGHTSVGSVRWGDWARLWADRTARDCALSEAQRGIRVTEAALAGDQPKGRVRLDLAVANHSRRTGIVTHAEGPDGPIPMTPQRLEPGASTGILVALALDQCPPYLAEVGLGPGRASPPVSLSVELPGIATPEGQWADGFPLGWDPAAVDSLVAVLTQACGGVGTVEIRPDPTAGVRYEPRERTYEGTLTVALPLGWRGLVTVRPRSLDDDGSTWAIPLWSSVGPVAPDPAGSVTVPVRYALPSGLDACWEEGFSQAITVQVSPAAELAGAREAAFSVYAEMPWPPGLDPRTVCFSLG